MIKWRRTLAFLFTLIGMGTSVSHAELSDPTRPPAFGAGGPLVLNAIMISPGHTLAVINGDIVHMGDELVGFKVTYIGKNVVILDGPEGRISLTLLTNPATSVTPAPRDSGNTNF